MSIEYKCNICKKNISAWNIRDNFQGASEIVTEWVDVGNYSVQVNFHIKRNSGDFLVCKPCSIGLVKKACKKLKADK